MTGSDRARGGAGSVLMLVPAAVLVLVVLAAIAVDSAIVVLAQRDLANRAAAAANDIAGSALSEESFYRSDEGVVALDQGRASSFLELAFSESRRPANYESWDARVETAGATVTVEATAVVGYLFARGVPGAARSATVTARSIATARGS